MLYITMQLSGSPHWNRANNYLVCFTYFHDEILWVLFISSHNYCSYSLRVAA